MSLCELDTEFLSYKCSFSWRYFFIRFSNSCIPLLLIADIGMMSRKLYSFESLSISGSNLFLSVTLIPLTTVERKLYERDKYGN